MFDIIQLQCPVDFSCSKTTVFFLTNSKTFDKSTDINNEKSSWSFRVLLVGFAGSLSGLSGTPEQNRAVVLVISDTRAFPCIMNQKFSFNCDAMRCYFHVPAGRRALCSSRCLEAKSSAKSIYRKSHITQVRLNLIVKLCLSACYLQWCNVKFNDSL